MKAKNLMMIASCLLALSSCTKKSSSTTTTTPTTPVTPATPVTPITPVAPVTGFTWIGNTTDTVKADSAYYDAPYKTIKAFKNGTTRFIEINLTAGTVGIYAVSSSNAISYIKSGETTTYVAAAGSVTIDSVVSGKMYGSFTSTGTGASLTSLSGTFKAMEVR